MSSTSWLCSFANWRAWRLLLLPERCVKVQVLDLKSCFYFRSWLHKRTVNECLRFPCGQRRSYSYWVYKQTLPLVSFPCNSIHVRAFRLCLWVWTNIRTSKRGRLSSQPTTAFSAVLWNDETHCFLHTAAVLSSHWDYSCIKRLSTYMSIYWMMYTHSRILLA